jgi:Methylamine utilisation protein MauE
VELIGLYFVACGLLVAAGVAKAIRPDDTARALGGLVPLSARTLRVAVRCGSAAEALLGAIALALPRSATAWSVAASYLGFAAVIAVLRRRGGAIASCGCFGTPDTPATMVHVVIDLVLALSAVAIAVDGPTGSLGSLLRAQPLDGVPLVAATVLCAWLTYLAISTLSEVEAARRLLGISRHAARRT